MRKMILALSCAAALGTTGSAGAATTFFNDFESGAYVGSGFAVLPSYEGWTASFGPGIEVQYGNVAGLAYSGKHLVELDSHSNSNMSRSIDAGSYTLTFQYSDRPNVLAGSNGIDVLLNGFSILSVVGGNGAGGTVWSQKSISFVAAPGPNVLTFAALGTSDSLGGYLDDIALSPVPEPASWAMMIGGLGLAGAAMRRRRTSSQFA
jgi:hypothetical protein